MMDDTRLDDAVLDVLVSEAVRVDAPEGFAVRVRAALDSRERPAHPRAWLRPRLPLPRCCCSPRSGRGVSLAQ